MKTVTLVMTDLLNDKQVERTIDIINAMSNGSECWELKGVESQRSNLESWIEERGNAQHDTMLELNSWTINN